VTAVFSQASATFQIAGLTLNTLRLRDILTVSFGKRVQREENLGGLLPSKMAVDGADEVRSIRWICYWWPCLIPNIETSNLVDRLIIAYRRQNHFW